ncbi:hypothetical protein HWV62_30421 [Athelia sp. TMB]|nr:hypothetical protein HWV62_44488 [Athelia sp. TMB]KAF7982097.1 hypothetical protein HWV62_30421 [Athelia sp. TMB]
MSASTVNVAVAHATTYLTRPLFPSHSAPVIQKLQQVLEANLIALFAPSWNPTDPIRGSGRRCLTLSPNCLPPRAIYNACVATGVQWFEWIAALGGREFDFFVDPGRISMRFGQAAPLITVWCDQTSCPQAAAMEEAAIQTQLRNQAAARAKLQIDARLERKTLAQQLLEEDEAEDDQIFAMIADEVAAPTWITPTLAKFPAGPRSVSPLSSTHSRSSSRSSNSSSGCFSYASSDSLATVSSITSQSQSPAKLSRRERARQAKIFVDTTKTVVTPYDGGKTTVLTGGVMLGGGPKPKKAAPAPLAAQSPRNNTWRSVRA